LKAILAEGTPTQLDVRQPEARRRRGHPCRCSSNLFPGGFGIPHPDHEMKEMDEFEDFEAKLIVPGNPKGVL
jgi:hypothetical protein